MIKKFSVLLMAIAVLSVVVAGCSKADDSAATSPAKDAKTTTTGN